MLVIGKLLILLYVPSVLSSVPSISDNFLDSENYEKFEESRKLTGQKCTPSLLRPCRYQNDFCIGHPPKCTTRNRTISHNPAVEKSKKRTTTEKYVSTSTTVMTTTTELIKILSTTLHEEEEPNPYKRYIQKPKKLKKKKSSKSSGGLDRQGQAPDEDLSDQNAESTIKPAKKNVTGTLIWDGKEEDDKPCLLDSEIDAMVNGPDDPETKDKWIDENKDKICNFDKFQVCYPPEKNKTDDDFGDKVEPETEEEEQGVCRCLESSFILLEDTCYIPAGVGTKSGCSKKRLQYVHVPQSPWGKPTLEPKCVPNAECVSSPQYFGLRCACKIGSRFFRSNHTCSDADRIYGIINFYLFASVILWAFVC